MNNILFFVHYNKSGKVHDHVVYLLERIRSIYSRIVLISNSPLPSAEAARLMTIVDDIYERANTGFDFYAWKEGMDRERLDRLASYETVTLMNDTCFGPIFDLESIYHTMRTDECHFWGMTNHREKKEIIPELGTSLPEHLQSFFLVFKAPVLASPVWRDFWASMECESDVFRVIAKYEIQLTRLLCEAGFRYRALLDTRFINLAPEELSYVPADLCLGNALPLLKIKALLQHRDPKHVIRQIAWRSDYPTELIERYFSQDIQPDKSVLYCNKTLIKDSAMGFQQGLKIALHIHVFYIDVWERYLERLKNFDFDHWIFITTDSNEKATEVKNLALKIPNQKRQEIRIVVLSNRGRDIMPWLFLSDELEQFDVVLHAHTKRSPTAAGWIGESWQQDVFDTILDQAPDIVEEFSAYPELGIVIPDVPRFWRYVAPVSPERERFFVPLMEDLWAEMGCSRAVDFRGSPAFVMPYGTMFWYRPLALKRLTSLGINEDRIPPEPLPEHTLLHAIERSLVYIAWDAGFDYRVVVPREIPTGFADVIERNRMLPLPPMAKTVSISISSASDADSSKGLPVSFFGRVAAKLRTLARPRKIVKMLMPYGALRIYQKLAERHRRRRILAPRDVPAPVKPRTQKYNDYWLRTHRHLHPLNVVAEGGATPRLNLVISSLGRAQLFGGIATCTGLATVVAKALDLHLRIITRDGGATHEQYLAIMAAMGIEPHRNISFYSDSSRNETGRGSAPLYCSSGDLFLASSWWTATALRNNVDNKKVYHIIQEDELMFYQMGDEHLNCLNALNAPDSKYLVNSGYLHRWFKDAYPKIYKNSVVFEPVFKKDLSRTFAEKNKYNLFFYARLTNPRNMFWFGMRVIDECFKRGILDTGQWDVHLAGDDSVQPVEFSGGKKPSTRGILSWDEYHEFLKTVDVGICLIDTPHPGYPVYDVASAGGVALTNTLYTKTEFSCSANIIACVLDLEEAIDGLRRAAELAANTEARRKNYLEQTIPDSWTESLAGVVDFFAKEMRTSA
ncbi:rhamnosyltransferase WsaF family glycosyltransferase [Pseudacidovorax intermedius]|uniref:rhamnosyltransferase WsaF family glycosyltransferase n=1 Tax=Pseudacidovorax intermedius TaxID=433924 RepID=UPI0009E900B6|nr:rhamnan synthesis F family protein [Pseudacidovorax intermedius]